MKEEELRKLLPYAIAPLGVIAALPFLKRRYEMWQVLLVWLFKKQLVKISLRVLEALLREGIIPFKVDLTEHTDAAQALRKSLDDDVIMGVEMADIVHHLIPGLPDAKDVKE